MAAAHQLTGVTWQDGATRRYHYEQGSLPALLTGITDELGVRIATYTYTASGRAWRTQGPGGSHTVEFSYGALGDRTDVIDRSGATPVTTTYRWQMVQGLVRPVSVSAPCPQCGNSAASTAYTASGEVARSVGHDGRITFFSYDAKGRETERAVFAASYNTAATRPALTLAESVMSTSWHAVWNLPLQRAEPGLITSLAYDTRGNLTSQSQQATSDVNGAAKFAAVRMNPVYGTGWTYNTTSLPTTIRQTKGGDANGVGGVETGRWTLTYNSTGDATGTTHAASGATSTATAFDAHGRMVSGRNDAGAAVALQYSPRGFVTVETLGIESIEFVQNAVGLTTEVRMPDNQALAYVYDATHKLTEVRLNGASITPAMLAMSDFPDTRANALLAHAKAAGKRAVSALIAPAHAQQISGQIGRRVIPVPWRPMPGQPEFDPRWDMMSVAPMSPIDEAARNAAEQFARMCECRPDGASIDRHSRS